MLDEYIFGAVDRISPEAPVPVVHKRGVEYTPGGAGNVAMNISSLSGEPFLVGAIGEDHYAKILNKILTESKISDKHLLVIHNPTIRKTRIIGGTQQIVRLDIEEKFEMDGNDLNRFENVLNSIGDSIDCIVISDYGKGMITEKTLDIIRNYADRWKASIVVDPKVSQFERYAGVDLITPNHKEAGRVTGVDITDELTMKSAGKKLLTMVECGAVLITWGDRGMVLFEGEDVFPIPTFAREVYDVVGAGDTVVATVALALSAGCSMRESALLSNHSAGIVVGKAGTATVSSEELISSLEEGNIG